MSKRVSKELEVIIRDGKPVSVILPIINGVSKWGQSNP